MPLPPPEPDISDSDDEDAEVLPDPGPGKRVKGDALPHEARYGRRAQVDWTQSLSTTGLCSRRSTTMSIGSRERRKWRGQVGDPTQRVGKTAKLVAYQVF